MSQNIYSCEVEQQTIDFTGRASLTSLIRAVVGVAGKDAMRNGFGVRELNESGHTWVLLKLAMELDYRPELGMRYGVQTWIESVVRMFSTRNFVLRDEGGEVFGGAISEWCIIDTGSRRAADIGSITSKCGEFVVGEKIGIERPRRLRGSSEYSVTCHSVRYSDTDFNRHLNAMRYVDWMLDAVPLEEIEGSEGVRIDLNFISECYLGDDVEVRYSRDGSAFVFEIVKADGALSARGSFRF